jgi:hypothetical protein
MPQDIRISFGDIDILVDLIELTVQNGQPSCIGWMTLDKEV